MNIKNRLVKLETKHWTNKDIKNLSDEELDARIAVFKAKLDVSDCSNCPDCKGEPTFSDYAETELVEQ